VQKAQKPQSKEMKRIIRNMSANDEI